MSKKKTNALRLLDQMGMNYDLLSYDYDPEHQSLQKVANENELDPGQIFKTLVCKGDKTGPIVAVLPANKHLNLKRLAQNSGNKKAAMVPMKDLLNLTGYIRGGCSPLGMKKKFPTYIAVEAQEVSKMFVNAGKRGFLFGIEPDQLLLASEAAWADVAEEMPQ
ncbi:MAG: Cys-tRNA(Pro) deacylase [Saprospiraceae bacterium]|nr:Cys-tRNA(Pro) deacylase [Saprospiraceae bacterium]